jgi:hypothetical protein
MRNVGGPFEGNSLETLAREEALDGVRGAAHECITYLPSRSTGEGDSSRLRLRKSHPSLYKQVIEGKLSMREACYALDQTSRGLGINNDQRLWILGCAMDLTWGKNENGE